MTTLQQFIEKHYNPNANIIDINKGCVDEEELKTVDGEELNLSEYPNIEKLRINSRLLKKPLKKLILKNNSQLKSIIILNSPELGELDISECVSLQLLVVNNKQIVTVEDCSARNIKG